MKGDAILPAAALQQHIAVLGKTGSGKTYAAKGLVEHLLSAHRRVAIIDPTGAWWGLRSSRDGKGPGFPILVLGGEHGDLPLPTLGGAAVARLVAEQHVNLIADTSALTVGEHTRWFIDFASTLYRLNGAPLTLVIDEAHTFAPQGKVPDPDTGKMLHAANRLASGGRSRGIRLVLITQRPQKLHKDALTSADTLLALRVLAPHDREAVKAWIDGCGDARQGKTVLDSLASLKRGEGWIWYPEGHVLERRSFPPIATYDSSATPSDGGRVATPRAMADVDLREVNAALADAVREAEANDPKRLRAKVGQLERELAAARTAPPAPAPPTRPVPALTPADRTALERAAARMEASAAKLDAAIAKADALASGCRADATAAREEARALRAALTAALAPAGPARPGVPPSRSPRPSPPPVTAPRQHTAGGTLTGPEQRILDALAWMESLGIADPEQAAVAFLAGYTIGGGAWNNPRGALRTKGLIAYLTGDRLTLTDAGRGHAVAPASALTAEELQRRVLERLPGPEGRLLRVLLAAYPDAVDNDELARAAGYEPGGGAFNNPRGRLRTLGLVEYPERGKVAARPLLFLDA